MKKLILGLIFLLVFPVFCFADLDTWCGVGLAGSESVTTETLRPNAGGYVNWTTWDSDSYPAQNTDLADDSDTTYVLTNSTAVHERHGFDDTAESGTVDYVTMYMRAKSTTADDTVQAYAYISTYYYADAVTLTTSFTTYSKQWDLNPATSSTWTTSDIDDSLFGFRSVSGSGEWQVADIWVVVTYE